MKKILCTLLSALLLLAALAGCSSQGGGPAASAPPAGSDGSAPAATGEKTHLTVWMPPFGTEDSLDKELWTNTLKPFEEANNVEVSVDIIPWSNYEEKYLTGLSSGQGPDVGYMYAGMLSDYISMGAIEPFDTYLTDADRDNFLYLDKGVINGKQYALPIIVGSARVIFYNKAILEKAGVQPPTTWDEFTTACEAIKATGAVPFLQHWGDKAWGAMNAIFFPYLWQAGGDLFSADGKTSTINSPEALKAAQFVHGLKEKGLMPESVTSLSEDQVFTEFKNGNLAFCTAPTSTAADFTKAGVDWGYIPSLKDQSAATFVAVDSLVLISASQNKELAAKLATFMLSGESMTEFHKMAAFPPVCKEEAYNDNPEFKELYETNKDVLRPAPEVKGATAIYDNLYKNLQLMMLDEITPEKALENAASYANEVLAQN